MSDISNVKVAVRIRPLVEQELTKGCRAVVEALAEYNQILIKSNDKAFTFNHVFGIESDQTDLYQKSVQPLLKNIFEGLNLTIFAYGQTGSGKTYSMGTTYNGVEDNIDNIGVIPRIVSEIFTEARNCFSIDFFISVSFLELYRENLYDLLGQKPKEQCILEIREDASKGIFIPNLTEISVDSAKEVLDLLAKGASARATGLTNMNAQSSRSHSVFTINVSMQHKTDKSKNKTAKLHLVDLAGSERSKKTGAQGTTFREGVDINRGLLVLGKVISALGDEKQHNNFIPYRESNLTRLLKDSLGGNSVTLMIACISPADYNLEETLSTLRYADNARKIKNRPIVNQDPKTAEINDLKKQIKQLKLEIVGQGGTTLSTEEINKLHSEIKDFNIKVKNLQAQLSATLMQKTSLYERNLLLQKSNDSLLAKLEELKQKYQETFTKINSAVDNEDLNSIKDNLQSFREIQESFNSLQDEQHKAETEIRKYEESVTNLLNSENNKYEKQEESYNMKQIELHTELEEITKKMNMKKELARKLTTNIELMINDEAMVETMQKIETLEKEKQDLLQQLTNVKQQETNSKMAVQHRKRIQELEEELKNLKKKISEQSKLIKLREKDKQKIQQLNSEIVGMKSTKVKLVKQMREESEKFRIFKLENERQLARVKNQERKKESEIVKLKINYEKQKNVLKRKFEEAAALNKRLQNTIMKKDKVQQAKYSGKIEKISTWIKDDLDIYVDFAEAEATLNELLEDRATLQKELDELKCHPNKENHGDIVNIENDIELRSIQIQDLQQKLIDSKDEDKFKKRFECLQTMSDAKCALKTVYHYVDNLCKNHLSTKRAISELQENNNSLQQQIEQQTQMINSLEKKHNEQVADIQQSYEEKVSILLRQLRGIKAEDETKDKDLLQRCSIQQERLQQQENQIEQQQIRIQELEAQLVTISCAPSDDMITPPKRRIQKSVEDRLLNTTFVNTTFTVGETNDNEMNQTRTIVTAENHKNGNDTTSEKLENQTKKEKTTSENDKVDNKINDSLNESFIDDTENDPDWRKTPLGKRIMAEKRARFNSELNGFKRTSDGGCTCASIISCNTKRCGCKKSGTRCGDLCKCKKNNCLNQETSADNKNEDDNKNGDAISSGSSSSSSVSNEEESHIFKKPK